MNTVTYLEIKQRAAEAADRTRDNFPTSEATGLLTHLAGVLPDVWDREAWPELCAHLEQVTLDANSCFDRRLGTDTEIGHVLAILDGSPLAGSKISAVAGWEDYGDMVHVLTSGSVWVDWQTPCPDLLDAATVGADVNTYGLPARFKLPLALLGGAFLMETENQMRAALMRAEADRILVAQATRIRVPYWRRLRSSE